MFATKKHHECNLCPKLHQIVLKSQYRLCANITWKSTAIGLNVLVYFFSSVLFNVLLCNFY